MAHEFLAIHANGISLIGSDFARLSSKQLRYALYAVEEVIQVHDHLQESGGW
jgi:hypothetical protein